VRIISGEAKGKKLYSPKGRGVRPTADRIKEAIFDILGPEWREIRALDLFSGTGSLGLEALSRGAERVVFVERSRPALNALNKNISLCGFGARARVMATSVSRALALIGKRGESFGIIFADPPYGKGWVEKTIEEVLRNRVLSRDGMIVIEHTPRESPPAEQSGLIALRQETYGETSISFLGFGRDRGQGGAEAEKDGRGREGKRLAGVDSGSETYCPARRKEPRALESRVDP